MTVLGSVEDPDGTPVELTAERWAHILEPNRHPELKTYREAVLRTVSTPDRRVEGRAANEQWFFGRGVGPSRWLQVVVGYEAGRGWIITAFARRADP